MDNPFEHGLRTTLINKYAIQDCKYPARCAVNFIASLDIVNGKTSWQFNLNNLVLNNFNNICAQMHFLPYQQIDNNTFLFNFYSSCDIYPPLINNLQRDPWVYFDGVKMKSFWKPFQQLSTDKNTFTINWNFNTSLNTILGTPLNIFITFLFY
jgi:hypothetical protein